MNQLKDSGKRQDFSTGSKRDTDEGKGQPSRISTLFLRKLSVHTQAGLQKYGDRNWEKGQPLSRYIDSMQRHLWKIQEGQTDEDHVAALSWNVMAFTHTKIMIDMGGLPKDLDDLSDYSAFDMFPSTPQTKAIEAMNKGLPDDQPTEVKKPKTREELESQR